MASKDAMNRKQRGGELESGFRDLDNDGSEPDEVTYSRNSIFFARMYWKKISTISFLCIFGIMLLHYRIGLMSCEEIQRLFKIFNNDVECRVAKYQEKQDVSSFVISPSIFVNQYDAAPKEFPRTENSQIPKVIHQIYKDTLVSNTYVDYMRTITKHMPDWQHVFWTDDDLEKYLLTRNGITEEDRILYHTYPHAINRADFARYLLMEQFGGIYIDLDVEFFKSIELSLHSDGGVYTVSGTNCSNDSRKSNTGPELETHMWLSVPNHPFWDILKSYLHQRSHIVKENFDFDVLKVTGPRIVVSAYEDYKQNKKESDEVKYGKFYELPCDQFNEGKDLTDGVTTHHFAHEWLWVLKRTNIQRVTGSIIMVLCSLYAILFILQVFYFIRAGRKTN